MAISKKKEIESIVYVYENGKPKRTIVASDCQVGIQGTPSELQLTGPLDLSVVNVVSIGIEEMKNRVLMRKKSEGQLL